MSEPLSVQEIRELLGATLHGPLPNATMQRVFSTLTQSIELEAALKTQAETICGLRAEVEEKDKEISRLRAEAERLDEEAQKCVNCCGTGGELDQLAAALKTARADALEEAALECERIASVHDSYAACFEEINEPEHAIRVCTEARLYRAAAAAIRALAAKDEEGAG